MSKSLPTVSIIVPNYNHEKYLVQRLDSIFNQTFTDFEVILLDDASTDGSPAILKQYADHPKVSHCLINSKNSGSVFKQWKKGIDLAKGEYIWIAESDDWADSSFLDKLLPSLQPAEVVLAYSQSYRVNEKGDILKTLQYWTADLDEQKWQHNFCESGKNILQKYMIHKNIIPNASAVLIKKNLLKTITIPEDMTLCGDWYIWSKLLKKGAIAFIAEPLNYFRAHPDTTRQYDNIKNRSLYIQEQIQVLELIKSILKSEATIIDQRIWVLTLGWLNFAGLKQSWAYRKTISLFPLFSSITFYKLGFLKLISIVFGTTKNN